MLLYMISPKFIWKQKRDWLLILNIFPPIVRTVRLQETVIFFLNISPQVFKKGIRAFL